ncbi:carbamoyltransferase [Nocardioides sp. cx-169]|uniref:carbamoyltransferase family protein n=1 Tax=Nocardioides sp. cx-169 TaxID=2899080 RepID=UPI001E3F2DF2|nr:carbamoyltransferase C-terminal domain-containing protein [Nocardioides sp. cx-169]MCD4532568.1 carbamoyltransferase [Nocardioides sp. cx-169]
MKVLGVNALFHDPAAALVVDGQTVAAAEEERFSRRKHGHRPVPFAAWELPEQAARWCLEQAGMDVSDLDAVTYSFDPTLARPAEALGLHDPWDHLRQTYAHHAPQFLATSLPGLDPAAVRFVRHHVAHAASGALASPYQDADVLVLDGRGECASHLAGRYEGGRLTVHATQELPHSLGLLYEELTEHLGFLRSSDEFKVMAMASYGTPRFHDEIRARVRTDDRGGFSTDPIAWHTMAKPLRPGEEWDQDHADLAASVQARLEEVLLELARWLRRRTGGDRLTLAGGVALNCVANTRLHAESGYDEVWVQPAAGDAGTALGSALHVAAEEGDEIRPMPGADLGRGWSDEEIEAHLRTAQVDFERPADVAVEVAECLAADGVVAWFQGRSEYGPRALGHRSLLAHPGRSANLERLNDVKGREQFRPVAPMVLAERASRIFSRGPLPSPYMLFVHDVAPQWRERIPAVVHVDGTARVQTVDRDGEPLVARMLEAFEQRTGLPVVINTSLNTAGRPMVDDPRDALECFGSAPVSLLAIGPFVVRRRPPGR